MERHQRVLHLNTEAYIKYLRDKHAADEEAKKKKERLARAAKEAKEAAAIAGADQQRRQSEYDADLGAVHDGGELCILCNNPRKLAEVHGFRADGRAWTSCSICGEWQLCPRCSLVNGSGPLRSHKVRCQVLRAASHGTSGPAGAASGGAAATSSTSQAGRKRTASRKAAGRSTKPRR